MHSAMGLELPAGSSKLRRSQSPKAYSLSANSIDASLNNVNLFLCVREGQTNDGGGGAWPTLLDRMP